MFPLIALPNDMTLNYDLWPWKTRLLPFIRVIKCTKLYDAEFYDLVSLLPTSDAVTLTLTSNRPLPFIYVIQYTKLYDPEANSYSPYPVYKVSMLSDAMTFTNNRLLFLIMVMLRPLTLKKQKGSSSHYGIQEYQVVYDSEAYGLVSILPTRFFHKVMLWPSTSENRLLPLMMI
jgi:hypothetical protein